MLQKQLVAEMPSAVLLPYMSNEEKLTFSTKTEEFESLDRWQPYYKSSSESEEKFQPQKVFSQPGDLKVFNLRNLKIQQSNTPPLRNIPKELPNYSTNKRKRVRNRPSKLTPEKIKIREEQEDLIKKNFDMKCRHCPLAPPFANFSKLVTHSKSFHKNDLTVSCCNQTFKNRYMFWAHLVKFHTSKGVGTVEERTCPDCGKICKSIKKRISHRYLCHNYCEECENFLGAKKNLPSLKSHQQQHAFSKDHKKLANYICDFCLKEFKFRDQLKQHLEQRHMHKVVAICHKCGIDFVNTTLFNQHNARFHQEGRFRDI